VICLFVATSSSNGLAALLAREFDDKIVRIEKKIFPDGELYVKIPPFKDDYAVVVSSLYKPQNEHLMELLLVLEALNGLNIKKIIVVIPYLAYARQDKRFLEGEPISVKVVLSSIEMNGVSAVITVDVHKEDSLKEWLNVPYDNIIPVKEVAEYFRKIKNVKVLAPDKGALHRAKLIAESLGTEYDYLEKFRDRITGEVRILPKNLRFEGNNILIVDDIISTGGTMALAARSALENNALKVYAYGTHALLVKGALDRLYEAGIEEVVSTNTVLSPITKISVHLSVKESLKKFL